MLILGLTLFCRFLPAYTRRAVAHILLRDWRGVVWVRTNDDKPDRCCEALLWFARQYALAALLHTDALRHMVATREHRI